MKQPDWHKPPTFPATADSTGKAETRRVFPEKFVDQLPLVLHDAPRAGRRATEKVLAAVAVAQRDPGLKNAMIDFATAVRVK